MAAHETESERFLSAQVAHADDSADLWRRGTWSFFDSTRTPGVGHEMEAVACQFRVVIGPGLQAGDYYDRLFRRPVTVTGAHHSFRVLVF